MSIDSLKSKIGPFAKDTKINISNVLSEEGANGLSMEQIAGVALASAYSTRNTDLIQELEEEYKEVLSAEHVQACKAAATIMAMNNVYYRFVHLSGDKEYASMPASLRMTVIGNPGIDKKDFELYSMAVSALNGCGMCMESHAKHLVEAGFSKQAIQSAVRIASVINAASCALDIA